MIYVAMLTEPINSRVVNPEVICPGSALVMGSRHLVRKLSPDEMGVCKPETGKPSSCRLFLHFLEFSSRSL